MAYNPDHKGAPNYDNAILSYKIANAAKARREEWFATVERAQEILDHVCGKTGFLWIRSRSFSLQPRPCVDSGRLPAIPRGCETILPGLPVSVKEKPNSLTEVGVSVLGTVDCARRRVDTTTTKSMPTRHSATASVAPDKT